jgi:hypothetical protein
MDGLCILGTVNFEIHVYNIQEKSEDTKGVIRGCKLKEDRKYNGQ